MKQDVNKLLTVGKDYEIKTSATLKAPGRKKNEGNNEEEKKKRRKNNDQQK